MTRKPRNPRKVQKPLRRNTMAAKLTKRDPLDDFIAVGARSLDLKIEHAWLPAVRGHLQIILRHGAFVSQFALPDDTEPAPVFMA